MIWTEPKMTLCLNKNKHQLLRNTGPLKLVLIKGKREEVLWRKNVFSAVRIAVKKRTQI